jgi:hypothetical protein
MVAGKPCLYKSHRVTPSGQFGVPYKMYFSVQSAPLQETNNAPL